LYRVHAHVINLLYTGIFRITRGTRDREMFLRSCDFDES